MKMMGSSSSSNNNNNNGGQFGDTTLTKVFVGGLAWETPKDTLREHFEKYGEILEAVIIFDKITGRSKGYGFVTFKEAEAAKKACEEPTVMINGRRANCNLASLGARRPTPRTWSNSSSPNSPPLIPSPTPPHTQGGARNNGNQVQWYYPVRVGTPTPPSPFHHHALPFYGYTPTYIAADHMNYNYSYNYNYNQKLSYGSGGGYNVNGQQLSHVYPSPAIVGAMPVYPVYHHFHRTETMGVPAHFFHHPTIPAAPHFAPSITPTTVGTGECFKRVV